MKRITLTEGKAYQDTIPDLADELGMSAYDLLNALYDASNSLSKRLSLSDTLSVDRGKFSFSRIAGVFPVTDQLEIEVIPKFLTTATSWRADFLLLLARTRWGLFAKRQMVSTSRNRERGINDSLALVFLTMFDAVAHVPIRTYQQRTIERLQIEGDLEEESVLMPGKDGFSQKITELTRRNGFNSVIATAAKTLSHSVSDFDMRSRLIRCIDYLGPQFPPPSVLPKCVPTRFRNWQDVYDLSKDILDGYGIDYVNQGATPSPAFVVRTSNAWEELIRQALLIGLSDCSIAFQEQHPFAKRTTGAVRVRPDYVVRSRDGSTLLVDAKYKYADARKKAIANSDIYEGKAFIEATQISRLVLIYPYADLPEDQSFEEFQRVYEDNWMICGVRVNPWAVGALGIHAFAADLGSILRPYLTSRKDEPSCSSNVTASLESPPE